jgi:hypothetical protein
MPERMDAAVLRVIHVRAYHLAGTRKLSHALTFNYPRQLRRRRDHPERHRVEQALAGALKK